MSRLFGTKKFRFKCNKFGAIKKQEDGYTFDSTSEWKRYLRLKFELSKGHISCLEVHPGYELHLGGDENETSVYSADFSYINSDGETIVEDVKNPALMDDMGLRLKLRMLKAQHNITVRLIPPDNAGMLPAYSSTSVDIPDF